MTPSKLLLTGASALVIAALAFAAPALADDAHPLTLEQKAERRAALVRQMQSLQGELEALDAAPTAVALASAADAAPGPIARPEATFNDRGAANVSEVLVTAAAPDVSDRPTGQTVNTVSREQFENTAAATIGDVLVMTPGVTFAGGNGPRDVSLSVRGSNARQTFGIRNVQVFEDGFPVTQPDGLARTDITDPHAYGRIDVVKGPSSALYGNYATSGAVKFYTRGGRELDGIELAADAGSDGYRNIYGAFGGFTEWAEYAGFASFVEGDGSRAHTGYRTTTFNGVANFAITPNDRLIFKFINNDLDADLSIRLSLTQFRQNPYQQGCEALAAPGCASVSLFTNGFNGARQNLSAYAAGLGRNDRRTIVGGRWEHDFSDEVTSRVQLVWDNRDIKQPTGATSAVGTFPSFNFIADATRTGELFGRPSTLFGGVFYNTMNGNSATYNVPASGTNNNGALTQYVASTTANWGARARLEVAVADQWTAVFGIGAEHTKLQALQTAYTYPTTTPTIGLIRGDRSFNNVAPEAAITFQPNQAWSFHARVGTGYGVPQVGNLFITPAGVPGNNTALDAQTVVGFDLGADVALGDTLRASVTGFYEFFKNELVSQSAGANLQNFTFNAPKSEHRGVEVAVEWRPLRTMLPGAKLGVAYLYNDQIYKTYFERLSAGAFTTVFDRSGNKIPGVTPTYLNARVTYEQPEGPLEGFGGYVEWNIRGDTYVDNANLLKAPGYSIVNAGLHYDTPDGLGALSKLRFYVSVQNIADKVYVGSASNISNTLNATTGLQNGAGVLQTSTGSIYAGTPRTVVGGVQVKF